MGRDQMYDRPVLRIYGYCEQPLRIVIVSDSEAISKYLLFEQDRELPINLFSTDR